MPVPKVYLLNGNGVMNAFATSFLNEKFVVLLSDVVDSFEDDSRSIDFYIGHELGHIKRKHLLWWPFIIPTIVFPLLYPAYRRACELTCDQYGHFCSGDLLQSQRALSLLASGSRKLHSISIPEYTNQISSVSGFWGTFQEITATYPWLSRRVLAIQDSKKSKLGNPFAWLIGMFCPGFITGGIFPLVFIYVAIIVAVAIPQYKKTAALQKKGAEITAASQSWKNPANGKTVTLPAGYELLTNSANKGEYFSSSFSPDQNKLFEELLQFPTQGNPEVYAKTVHGMDVTRYKETDSKVSPLKLTDVGGIMVGSYSYNLTHQNINFDIYVRIWTTKTATWQFVSTIRQDSPESYAQDDEFFTRVFEGTL